MYAYNGATDRVPLWNDLICMSITTYPWCVLGDFNCVTRLEEVKGVREHWTLDMQVFRDYLLSTGPGSICMVRDLFTWMNKCLLSSIYKCLDRAIENVV